MKTPLPKFWAPVLEQGNLQRKTNGRMFWIGFAILITGLNLYAPGEPTFLERALASLVMLSAAVPVYCWLRKEGIEAAFLPLFGINFSIYYSLGVFVLVYGAYLGRSPLPGLADTYNEALALSIGGLLLVFLGYYGPWWRHIIPRLPACEMPWRDAGAVQFVACTVGLFSLIFYWISFRESLSPGLRQPLALGANVFVLSLIVLLILHLQHRLNRISIFLLYGVLIPARVLIGVSQGFLAPAIIVGLATLMTYATLRRRIPWLFVAAGFGIFALIQPVKASLRSQVWANGTANREQSEADKLQALSSATQLGMEFADTFGFQAAVSIAVERLSMLVLFEKVIAYTPSDIPYWEGETYYPLLFKPIPRALWEDKPDETRAN
jgi:hypothetical protein